jgi:hypothetical protein
VTGEEIKNQVSRFVGFAIHGIEKKWKKISSQGDDCDDETLDCVESAVLDYVSEMFFLHPEAIGNSWYLENCYPASLQLLNCGYLKLVSPSYFEWGESLMQFIASHFSMRVIKEEGREAIDEAFKQVNKDEDLWKNFLRCSKSSLPVNMKRKIYNELVSKAFHARIGVVTDKFNEVNTGHYAEKASGQGFRAELQAITKKKSEQMTSGANRKLLEIQGGPTL